MKKYITFLILLFSYIFSFSQATLQLEWTLAEPDASPGLPQPKIILNKDNNPCVCANTHSVGPFLGYVTVQYDSLGNLLWKNHFDEIGLDILMDCVADTTGAIIVGGETSSLPGSQETILLIKYNTAGEEVWMYHYQSPLNESVSFSDLMIDDDQNLYVIGRTWDLDDLLVVKIDPSGNQIWERRISDPGDKRYSGWLGRVLDDKIVVLGSSNGSSQDLKYVILQLDFDGQPISLIENVKEVDVSHVNANFDFFGNLILGRENGGYNVTKVNPQGDTIWHFAEPLINSGTAGGTVIDSDEQGNVYVSGFHTDSISADILTIKFDSVGTILWKHRFDYQNTGMTDWANNITIDEQYVYVVGVTKPSSENRNGVLVIYSRETGEFVISKDYDNNGNKYDIFDSVVSNSNAIYITGTTDNGSQTPSFLLTQKYILDIESSIQNQTTASEKVKVFPNPAEGYVQISFEQVFVHSTSFSLLNSQGQTILKRTLPGGQLNYVISLSNIPAGLYYYLIKNGDRMNSGKLIHIQK